MNEKMPVQVEKKERIKTRYAQVIVSESVEKPYFEILWYDEKRNDFNIGYGSYCMEYVFQWLNEEFEFTEEKTLYPIIYAKWEWFDENVGTPIDGYDREWGWRCSKCKDVLDDEYDNPDEKPKMKYCPHCGARIYG